MLVDSLTLRETVSGLVEFYQYSKYRNYKIFTDHDAKQIFREGFLSSDEGGTHFFPIEKSGNVFGVIKISRADWDCSHFEFPMYRISCIHDGRTSSRGTEVSAVVCSVLDFLKVAHVVAEVDHEDYFWLNALIGCGFRIYDSKSNYVFRRHQKATSFRAALKCREFCPGDKGEVMEILRGTSFPSRFSRDPFFTLRAGKVQAMYSSWVENLVSKKSPDDPALVVERSGKVVAFGAGMRVNFPLDNHGKILCGNSLFFCRKDAVGSYPALAHYLTLHTKKLFDALELGVSITNYPAVRVLERLGFQMACGSHSLSIQVER